ncbi:MAG: tetratricopeptide (TPR) repeat protein [Desulforhopalus sp.]|jgi:tetratricopeptide (TPR) repeat protein
MTNLFFSYASQDSAIVLRTYNDLSRDPQVYIWCYELDSRPGYNFREQYIQSIKNADYFLLFDSPHSRKSEYVIEEIATWQRLGKKNPVIPCLACPKDNWFHRSAPFNDLQNIAFIDLTIYNDGFQHLNTVLKTSPHPSFIEPGAEEFAEELKDLRPEIGITTYMKALQHYARFEESRAHNPDLALSHMEVMVAEIFSQIGKYSGSALLIMANDYFTLERFHAAERVYRIACSVNSMDPRGWAGLGFVQAKNGQFSDAMDSFSNSLTAIDHSDNINYLNQRSEILNALCTACFLSHQYAIAWNLIENELSSGKANATTYGFGARLQLIKGDHRYASRLLFIASTKIQYNDQLDAEEVKDLIDMARLLEDRESLHTFSKIGLQRFPGNPRVLRDVAAAQADLRNEKASLKLLDRAWEMEKDNPRIGVELALLYRHQKNSTKCNEILNQVLHASNGSGEKSYYVGLAHYMQGRKECADYFYRSSKIDKHIDAWPEYLEIVDS